MRADPRKEEFRFGRDEGKERVGKHKLKAPESLQGLGVKESCVFHGSVKHT